MNQLKNIKSSKLLGGIFYHQSLIVREPLRYSDDNFIYAFSSLFFGKHAHILHHHGDHFFRIKNFILCLLVVVSRSGNLPSREATLICIQLVRTDAKVEQRTIEATIPYLRIIDHQIESSEGEPHSRPQIGERTARLLEGLRVAIHRNDPTRFARIEDHPGVPTPTGRPVEVETLLPGSQ